VPIAEEERSGWRALVVDNEQLAVCVLPDKGGDLYELVHRGRGVDVLFKAPWGLAPPGAPPRAGADGHAFLETYEGGWQTLLPNTNDPCRYRGVELPFHGEVCSLPWIWSALGEDGLRLQVDCRLLPLRLVRELRLDGSTLVLSDSVTNVGEEPCDLVLGHHCVLGPPFLADGCRLEADASELVTGAEVWEETARLEPGQRAAWPSARLAAGGEVDLREVPGPEAGSHDDVFLTGLRRGRLAVESPHTGLRFRLDWDAAVFRWIVSWQAYGGAHAVPLAGSYALGVEPWVAGGNLEAALAAGQALRLEPGASLSTDVTATIEELHAS
jgi:galactose mutarotase-like enzyme